MTAIMTKMDVEAAVSLDTLIDSYARDAGRELGETLRPWLREGEVLPDFSLVLQLPSRMIGDAGRRLRDCQDELGKSRRREGEARISRDQTASTLRKKLVELRKIVSAAFDSQRTGELLGFTGATALASQPKLLLSQADAVLKALGDPKRLAKPDTAYLDAASAAASLEPMIVASRDACGHLDAVRQTSASRLDAKDRASADLGRGIHSVASILAGWLDLVRRPDLAKRLRCLRSLYKAERAKNAKRAKRKEVPM